MATTPTITNDEYLAIQNDREAMRQKMENAESEFVYQTYKEVWSVLNRRYAKATELIVAVETRDARTEAAAKRKARTESKGAV